MLDRFRLLFQYELWANRQTLTALEAASDRGSTVRLFAHILAAQQAWLTRLRGEDSTSIAIWPTTTLEDCGETLERMNGEIKDYLGGLDEAELDIPITYRNQSGAEFSQSPLDILTHLGLHSQHHRGQIALQLRQLGQEPAVTDFIAFRRLA